jgi:glyoxylate reductase
VPEADALGAEYVGQGELLERADFVSLHCPLSADTHHLIGAGALARMKSSAVLVNTSRGGCIDEAALVHALDDGQIAAAGLDVFENEPVVHPGLIASDRVVLAPHIGSATHQARSQMAEICARAVRSVLSGDEPMTALNPEAMR